MSTFEDKHKPELWDVLWESAIGGLALVAEDGTFIRANPAFCKIVEYSEPELQEIKFQDITIPADRDVDEDLAGDVAAGRRRSYDMVKSYMTKTRKVVWVHLRVVPFKVNDKFCYFLSQIFEVPVSIVSQMGFNAGDAGAYVVEPARPKINWNRIIRNMRDWLPFIAFVLGAGALGVGWALGVIGFQTPPTP